MSNIFRFGLVVQSMDAYLEELSSRFARMRPRLEVIAARILGDHEEAADVVSDVYLSLTNQPPRTPQALPAWLMVSVRNRALNRLRTRGRNGSVTNEEELSSSDVEIPEVEADAIANLVSEVIESLSERDKAFVTARFFEGVRTEDLAAEHATTVAQARIVLHRAVVRLRKRLVDRLADLHSVPEEHRAAILAMVAKGEWNVNCSCAACRRLGDELSALRKLRATIPYGIDVGRGWLKKAAVAVGAASMVVMGAPVVPVPPVGAEPQGRPASDPSAVQTPTGSAVKGSYVDQTVPSASLVVIPAADISSVAAEPSPPTIPKTGGTNNALSYKKPMDPAGLVEPAVNAPTPSLDQAALPDVPGANKVRI